MALAAITGGTGFLGRHVLAALTARNWRLRMLSRQMPDLLQTGPNPIEVIPGTLADGGALTRLVQGADAIIHIAGVIKARNSAAFMMANAQGTAAIATAWRQHAPNARMIYVSSMAAREPTLSAYAASKAKGEQALRDIHPRGWTILRPPAIYGPGDQETRPLFRAANWPMQPMLNSPKARLCLIHAQDAADAILATARPDGPDGVFEISDQRHGGYSWPEIIETACAVQNRRAKPVRVPAGILYALGFLCNLTTALGVHTAMLSVGKIREILHMDWSLDPARQLPSRFWQPKIALETGFQSTAAWYQKRAVR